MFFVDYDMIPLMVQESYLSCLSASASRMKEPAQRTLARQVNAADYLAHSDVASRYIRSRQEWGMLPTQAAGVVTAAQVAMSRVPGWMGFPRVLGMTSAQNKRSRLLGGESPAWRAAGGCGCD